MYTSLSQPDVHSCAKIWDNFGNTNIISSYSLVSPMHVNHANIMVDGFE